MTIKYLPLGLFIANAPAPAATVGLSPAAVWFVNV